jgi:hypothetical protein
MKTFPDADRNGIPNIPARYRYPEGHLGATPSWNPYRLIAGENYITYGIIGARILILLILGWLILVIKNEFPEYSLGKRWLAMHQTSPVASRAQEPVPSGRPWVCAPGRPGCSPARRIARHGQAGKSQRRAAREQDASCVRP